MKIGNNNITMVVSDFDGTLLRGNMSKPSHKFYDVLQDMLDKGIGFVAASGRQFASLRKMMSDVEDKIGFIAENGSLVIWKGEIVHKSYMQREHAMDLIEELKRESNTEIYVSGVDRAYLTSLNQEFINHLHYVGMEVDNVSDFAEIQEDIIKVCIIYKDGIPTARKAEFKDSYGDLFDIVDSGNGWLDFIPKGSGKGSALKILSEHVGFSLEETVAFGDQENDISMLKVVKIGYAMNTAHDYIKEVADDTCSAVEDTLWDALYGYTA